MYRSAYHLVAAWHASIHPFIVWLCRLSALLFICGWLSTPTHAQGWAKALGGPGDDQGRAVVVDAAGNVYTTGYFSGTADFDPGPGVASLTAIGTRNIFVSKLEAAGNFVWAKAFTATSFDVGGEAYGIAVDASGNVYTTGRFSGTVDFDPGSGVANLTGFSDVFVSKLDASGSYVWAKAFGGTDVDFGLGIVVDATGNVYTTGYFRSTADFDPGSGVVSLTSVGEQDVFVSKLSATGNYIWAKAFGGTGIDRGSGIAVDVAGNVCTTGYFQSTADFDPDPGVLNLTSAGSNDVFVSKLNALGSLGGGSCGGLLVTVKAGNWNDPTVWSCGQVPGSSDLVSVGHAITVPTSYLAKAGQLRYTTGGRVIFNTPSARLRVGP